MSELENSNSCDETIVKIPDLRFKFSDDLPIVHLEGAKKISGKDLFNIYLKLEKYLCSMPNSVKTTDGELIGWKDNYDNLVEYRKSRR